MRVLSNVSQGVVHTVTLVVGYFKGAIIQYFYKARIAAAMRSVHSSFFAYTAYEKSIGVLNPVLFRFPYLFTLRSMGNGFLEMLGK